MKSKAVMSVAARALLAAGAIGFSGAAWAQVSDGENGAHAVPAGAVGQAALPAVGVRRVAAVTAAEPRLKLQAVEHAPSADDVQPLDADPAPPANAAAAPASTAAEPRPALTEEQAVMGPPPPAALAAQAPPVSPPALAAAPPAAPQPQAVAPAPQLAEAAPPPAAQPAPPPRTADAAPAPAAPAQAPAAAAPPAPQLAAAPPPPPPPAPPPASAPAQALASAAQSLSSPAAPIDPAAREVRQLASDETAAPAAPAVVDPEPRMARVADREPEPPPPAAEDEGIHQRVGFPRRSADAASAFVRYMDHTSRIDAALKSGQAVGEALTVADAYDARQLDEGMIAYGAMAALQSPTFVYGVMDLAANDRTRRALVDELLNDPSAAARLPGAQDAARLAGAAIGREGRRVLVEGKALKQAAYDVQLQGWSKLRPVDQAGRLAAAKAASSRKAVALQGDVAKLLARISTAQSEDRGSAMTPLAARSLALAALSVLDGAGDGNSERLETVMTEPTSAECLKLAKLNLFQCLSVAGPEYEDVYCLGQHAVLDTAQCVASAVQPASPIIKASLPDSDRSQVLIPAAGLSGAPAE